MARGTPLMDTRHFPTGKDTVTCQWMIYFCVSGQEEHRCHDADEQDHHNADGDDDHQNDLDEDKGATIS